MSDTRIEPCVDDKGYLVEKITVSNIPDIGDTTGATLLNNLEEAIQTCRIFMEKGFRLTNLWSEPDIGFEFVLKKKKAPGEKCDIVLHDLDRV